MYAVHLLIKYVKKICHAHFSQLITKLPNLNHLILIIENSKWVTRMKILNYFLYDIFSNMIYINYYIYHVYTTFISAPFCCQDFLCIQLYVSMLIVFYLNDFINAEPTQNERNFYSPRKNIASKIFAKVYLSFPWCSYHFQASTV